MSDDKKIINPDVNTKATNTKEIVLDSKAMLKEAANKKLKIRRADRTLLKVVKHTKYYKKGQIIEPHQVVAKALVKAKVAEAYTAPKAEK